MQRHMQNISFLAIVGVLLGCAYFFSQLTKVSQREVPPAVTPSQAPETVADIPDCDADLAEQDVLACLVDAAEVSDHLVENAVDEIRQLESDPERRVAFLDTQIAWEESRKADCDLVYAMADDTEQGETLRASCLRERNLQRLAQLEKYICDWYPTADCAAEDLVED
jgi:uncharacterized protein YecT (DUF1311 family)